MEEFPMIDDRGATRSAPFLLFVLFALSAVTAPAAMGATPGSSATGRFVPAGAAPPQSARTAIVCGALIDGRNDLALADGVVVIEGDTIVSVGAEVPAGAEVIDLSDSTCLPGLIDAHVHPLIATDDYQTDHLRHSSAYKALRGLRVVQDMLQAGWTTLRIAGDADVFYAPMDIRAAIDEGMFVGPRIVGAAHYLSITGGGGDINYLAPELSVVADGLVVDGVDEIRNAVREEIKFGSDWIKVLVTGAFMSANDSPLVVQFSPEEMAALATEANRLGVPVMAHAHATDGIKLAIISGVRSIEHGTMMDDEGIAMMLENGVYWIPTLAIGDYLQGQADSEALAKAVELGRIYDDPQRAAVRRAIEAGVMIGVGSDYVGGPVVEGMREYEALVELGMTPMQAIQAGTRVNAEMLEMDDRIGTLEPGKLADLIAVPGDPLSDIGTLRHVEFVMIGGQVVRLD
jgi:imidazolonepropionase-like amidohydrolase